MDFLEKDLEEIIFSTPNEQLRKRGLNINGIKRRQVYIGNYGRADIITRETSESLDYYPNLIHEDKEYFSFSSEKIHLFTIYELKQNKLNINSFLQAINYCKGISDYIDNNKCLSSYNFNICLIGKEIDKSNAFCYLPDFINSSSFSLFIYTYSYEFDGVKFKSHSQYSLTDNGFYKK
jgi:hypothetical protein